MYQFFSLLRITLFGKRVVGVRGYHRRNGFEQGIRGLLVLTESPERLESGAKISVVDLLSCVVRR